MKTLSFRNHTDLAKAISLLLMLVVVAPGLRAASGTWTNGASTNLWQTSSNWSVSPFPGTTSGFASTDTATFGSAGSGTIALGGTLNVKFISIGVSGGNSGAFTLGNATDTLNLTSFGIITVNGGVTANETIGTAGGGIINTSTVAGSTASFLNNGQGTLTVAGALTANQTSGNATTVTLGGVGNGNVSGVISGGGTAGTAAMKIVKAGSGTWTLAGANTYTGNTTVNGGKLVFDYTTNVPIATTSTIATDNGAVTFKGNTSGTTSATVGNLWLSSSGTGTRIGTSNTLTLDSNGGSGVNLTITSFSGAAAPWASNLIDLSSNANNSINVTALGTNTSSASGVLMTGSRAVYIVRDTGGYGFATLSGNTTGTIGRLTTGTTLDAGTTGNNTLNYFLTSNLTRTATLAYNTLTINSTAGAVTLAMGANNIQGDGSSGRGLLVFGNHDVNITGTGNFTASSGWVFNYGTATLTMSQGTGTSAGMVFGGTGLTDYAGTVGGTMTNGLYFEGGIVRLSKAQDLTAVTTTFFNVTGGGVLEIGADLNGGATAGDFTTLIGTGATAKTICFLGDSGLSAYGANRVVNFGGAAAQITWGTGGFLTNTDGSDGGYTFKLSSTASNASIEVQNAIALGTSKTRVVDVADGSSTTDAILSGVLSGSGASLTKTGAGTLSLTGNNTYTGMTTVSAGAINISSSGSLASGNALTLGASGTADFANVGQTLGAVSNDNTATNALNFSAATGTVTLASLSGAGNTHFASNGIVTGGISSGTVTSNGSLTADISGGTITAGGLLTGNITSGTVGAGSLSASSVSGGTNNITGAANITSLSGGATTIGGVATIGTMTSGTTNLNGATGAISTLNGGSILLGNSTVLTVSNGTTSGPISGGGSLTKATSGTLVLSGNNTYTGTTTVTGGTLQAAGTNALGSTAGIMINTGGTLLVSANGSIGTSAAITMNSTATGNGTAAALKFSSSYNGTVGALTLDYNSIFDLGTDATGVQVHFSSLFLNGHTLSIYNWTGTTLWEGGTGNNTDQIYAGNTLDAGDLSRISFYSGLDTSSFRGTGYQIMTGSFMNELGPVPEPSTWVAMAALVITGGTISMRRRTRQATEI